MGKIYTTEIDCNKDCDKKCIKVDNGYTCPTPLDSTTNNTTNYPVDNKSSVINSSPTLGRAKPQFHIFIFIIFIIFIIIFVFVYALIKSTNNKNDHNYVYY